MAVHFHTEDIQFKVPAPARVKAWVQQVVAHEGFETGTINYIFCSDEHLLNINKEYLQHDYYTDIITFDMSDSEDVISADIFVSIDRVRDNARDLGVDETEELHRVLIHGVLHLCGYGDKTKKEQEGMRNTENQYIKLILG